MVFLSIVPAEEERGWLWCYSMQGRFCCVGRVCRAKVFFSLSLLSCVLGMVSVWLWSGCGGGNSTEVAILTVGSCKFEKPEQGQQLLNKSVALKPLLLT